MNQSFFQNPSESICANLDCSSNAAEESNLTSSFSKPDISLSKRDPDYSNPHTEQSTAASSPELFEYSFPDSDCGVALKECYSTTVSEFKKKNTSLKRDETPSNKQSVVCEVCGRYFKRQQELNRHLMSHTNLKPFSCTECGEAFTRKGNVKRHMLRKHIPNHYEPSEVDINDDSVITEAKRERDSTTFLMLRKMEEAVTSKSNEASNIKQTVICKFCCRNFKRRQELERHMVTHDDVKPFSCADCGETFTRKDSVRRHGVLKHPLRYESNDNAPAPELLEYAPQDPDGSVTMMQCNSTASLGTEKNKKLFSTKQNKVEKSDHNKSFVCNICNRIYKFRYHLNRHLLLHKDRKPFECADCGRSFTRKEHLKDHILLVHIPFHTRQHDCDNCGKFYSSESKLKRHKQRHSICGVKNELGQLKQNQVSNPSQLFVCKICDRMFKRKDQLKTHMLIHKGVKPFKCPECDRPFLLKWHMEEHILLTHTSDEWDGNSYYFCAHCIHRSKSKANLAYHIKNQHLSDLSLEEFSCTICNKTFTRNSSRTRHEQMVHKIETLLTHIPDRRVDSLCYICAFCNHVCESKANLASHIKEHHSSDSDMKLKNFSCTLCGKRFTQDRYRKRHERTVHVKNDPIRVQLWPCHDTLEA